MPRRSRRPRRRLRKETPRSQAKERDRLLELIAAGLPWERPVHDLDVDHRLEELLTGHDLFALGFKDDHARAAAWEDVRDAFLAEHVRRRPGTRPWAWWKYQAPEPRLVVRGEMIPSPSAVTWYGTPSAHAGDAIFESQAAYLRRLDLLKDGEHVEHETEPDDPVTAFARSVTAGDATVGRLERAAAARHLDDLRTAHERDPEVGGYYFDRLLADRRIRFCRYFRHYQGRWDGQVYEPAPWRNLQRSIEGYTSGLERSHRVLVLEEGIEVEKIGIPPGDSQFIETSNHQVEDIARFFRMPLHKIGHLLRATFSNIEQQDLDYYKSTLLPVLVRFEAAIRCQLIPEEAQDHYFAEFLVENVLRADIETRYKAYSTAVQNGIMTRNEARARENLDPDPSRGADALTVQLNLVPIELLYGSEDGGEPSEPARALESGAPAAGTPAAGTPAAGASAETRAVEARAIAQLVALRLRYRRSIRPMLERAFERLGAVEIRKAEREFKKALSQADPLGVLRRVMRAFHEADFPRVIERELAPVLASFAELLASAVEDEIGARVEVGERHVAGYVAFYARRHAGTSLKQIDRWRDELAGVAAAELTAGLAGRLEEWRTSRPAQTLKGEMVRFEGSTVLDLYRRGGRTRKRWAAVGKNCPFCSRMDGRVVALEEPFAADGAVLRGERDGEEVEIQISGNRGHAPLHRACDCVIVSA